MLRLIYYYKIYKNKNKQTNLFININFISKKKTKNIYHSLDKLQSNNKNRGEKKEE